MQPLVLLCYKCAGCVSLPADCSAGHGGDNPGLQPTEVPLIAFSLVDDPCCLDQTRDRSQLGIVCISSCLQQRLDDV